MHHAARVAQEPFYEARMEFEDLIEQLLSPVAADLTHSQAEDLIEGIVKLLGMIVSPGNSRHFPDAIATDPALRRPALSR